MQHKSRVQGHRKDGLCLPCVYPLGPEFRFGRLAHARSSSNCHSALSMTLITMTAGLRTPCQRLGLALASCADPKPNVSMVPTCAPVRSCTQATGGRGLAYSRTHYTPHHTTNDNGVQTHTIESPPTRDTTSSTIDVPATSVESCWTTSRVRVAGSHSPHTTRTSYQYHIGTLHIHDTVLQY